MTRISLARASRAAIILFALAALPASAHKRDFAFTYDWWTPMAGEREFESTTDYSTADKAAEGALEYETGLTERWSLAAYYLYTKENGEAFRNEGYQFETRYRLGEFATDRFLPALYAEYANSRGEPAHGEAKLILSRYMSDRAATDVSLNLIGARRLNRSGEEESGYAAGVSRQWTDRVRYGVEAVGGFNDGSLALGPTFTYDASTSTRAVLGAVSSVRHGNGTEVRLLLEYEF